jgi:hypothetical protein
MGRLQRNVDAARLENAEDGCHRGRALLDQKHDRPRERLADAQQGPCDSVRGPIQHLIGPRRLPETEGETAGIGVGVCLESPYDRSLQRRSIEGNERGAFGRTARWGGRGHGCRKVTRVA